jgi:hypothetical protein
MYEKCATILFGVFGLGRVHYAKIPPAFPSFSSLPFQGVLSIEPSLCGDALSLYAYILFLSFCLFILG